jgi:hypothetical protein
MLVVCGTSEGRKRGTRAVIILSPEGRYPDVIAVATA